MAKKIEKNNKNNKIKKSSNQMTRKSSGSKTSKKDPPKKRGRRPKKILENVDMNAKPDAKNKNNNSAVILRLNIDPSKLNIDSKKKSKKKESSDSEKTESSDGMFKNDIPKDNSCHKCSKYEKRITLLESELDKLKKRDKLTKKNKVYVNKINFISMSSGKKVVLKKTNQKCLWDSHPFNDLPCFLPEIYHNNTYYVTGCFCSFNCALAHNLYYLKDSKIYHRKSLVYKLYKEIHDIAPDEHIEIKEAPPREILSDFGGTMSIEAFRRSFNIINKEYIIYMPPIKPISTYIEERNTDDAYDDDDKEFVLKRTKPLSKKKSIISSMKISVDDES